MHRRIFDFYVSLSPAEVLEVLKKGLCKGFYAAEVLDEQKRITADGKEIILLFMEKYLFNADNVVAMFISADDLEGRTKVHISAASGAKNAHFTHVDGYGDPLAAKARDILKEYKIDDSSK